MLSILILELKTSKLTCDVLYCTVLYCTVLCIGTRTRGQLTLCRTPNTTNTTTNISNLSNSLPTTTVSSPQGKGAKEMFYSNYCDAEYS